MKKRTSSFIRIDDVPHQCVEQGKNRHRSVSNFNKKTETLDWGRCCVLLEGRHVPPDHSAHQIFVKIGSYWIESTFPIIAQVSALPTGILVQSCQFAGLLLPQVEKLHRRATYWIEFRFFNLVHRTKKATVSSRHLLSSMPPADKNSAPPAWILDIGGLKIWAVELSFRWWRYPNSKVENWESFALSVWIWLSGQIHAAKNTGKMVAVQNTKSSLNCNV